MHVLLGLGLEYTTYRGLGIRAEGIQFDTDITYGQLSLLYRFGQPDSRKAFLIADKDNTSQSQSAQVVKPAIKPTIKPGIKPAIKPPQASVAATTDRTAPKSKSKNDTKIKTTGITDASRGCTDSNIGSATSVNGCFPSSGVLDGVTFPPSSAFLTDRATARLTELVTTLKSHPNRRFRISAHTDNTGEAGMNLELSKRRVKSVGIFLKKAGIPLKRFDLRAFGETRPIAPNNTVEGRRTNRRVELKWLQ